MILKARKLLDFDPDHAHRSGILLIVEKDSIFSKKHQHTGSLLDLWRKTIINCGFDFLKYEYILFSNRRVHFLAFRVCLDPLSQLKQPLPPSDHEQEVDVKRAYQEAKMWIRHDLMAPELNANLGTS